MPLLPASGTISLSDINTVYYYAFNRKFDMNSEDYRDLVNKLTPGTTLSLDEAYSKKPNIKIPVGEANNNLYNVNLRSIAEETRPQIFENGDPRDLAFTFTVYGNIGSKSTASYALRTGYWHSSIKLTLNVLPVRRADGKMMNIYLHGDPGQSVKLKDYVDQGTGQQKYQTVSLPTNPTSTSTFRDLQTNSPPSGIIGGKGADATTSGCCDCNWCYWGCPKGGPAILLDTDLTINNTGIIGSGGTGGHGITQNRDNQRQGSAGAGAGLDPGTSVWAAHCSPETSYLVGACGIGASGGDLGGANLDGGGLPSNPAIITSGHVLTYSGPGLLRGGVSASL